MKVLLKTKASLLGGLSLIVLLAASLMVTPARGATVVPVEGQRQSNCAQPAVPNFIPEAALASVAGSQATGVPISVTIAQAILESDWGRKHIGEANNYFGIKAVRRTDGTIYYGQIATGYIETATQEWNGSGYVTVMALFRKYANMSDSFADHAQFFVENTRYANAFNFVNDPNEFARQIHQAGYATDPQYANKLINIMTCYNLYQYDNPGGVPVTGATATVLLIDVSGSMADSWQGGVKIESAKAAASQLTNMLEQESSFSTIDHRVGLAAFSTDATLLAPLSSDFPQLRNEITNLYPQSSTNMGDGLIISNQALTNANPTEKKYIILLSDGMSNRGLSHSEILTGPVQQAVTTGTCIYTVGFGDPGNLDENFLREVAAQSGCGEYYYATNISELEQVYIRIRHVSTGRILAEYNGTINQGQTLQAGVVQVPPNQEELAISLQWPGSKLVLQLTDPNGNSIITNDPNVSLQTYSNMVYALIRNPLPGDWSIGIYGSEVPEGVINYNAIVSSRQGIVLPTPTMQPTPTPTPAPAPLVGGSFPFVVMAIVLGGSGVGIYVYNNLVRRKRGTAGASKAYLAGIAGEVTGQQVILKPTFYIGRGSNCDLVLHDPSVSRLHARIRFAQGSWYIQDQDSHSGVRVNGQKVSAARLKTGDQISIGGATWVFRV